MARWDDWLRYGVGIGRIGNTIAAATQPRRLGVRLFRSMSR